MYLTVLYVWFRQAAGNTLLLIQCSKVQPQLLLLFKDCV